MNFLERDERRALKFENKLNSFERPKHSMYFESHYQKILEDKVLETSSTFNSIILDQHVLNVKSSTLKGSKLID